MKIGKAIDAGLIVAAGTVAASTLFLALQIKHASPPAPAPTQLTAGSVMPALVGRGLNGVGASVTYGSDRRPTVLYVFSPGCAWCRRNMANLHALMQADRDRFRWVGVSLVADGVQPYLAANRLAFDQVVANPSPASRAAYHLGPTPDTFVLGPDGRLEKLWPGAYGRESARASIASFFGVSLPAWPAPDQAANQTIPQKKQ